MTTVREDLEKARLLVESITRRINFTMGDDFRLEEPTFLDGLEKALPVDFDEREADARGRIVDLADDWDVRTVPPPVILSNPVMVPFQPSVPTPYPYQPPFQPYPGWDHGQPFWTSETRV